MTLVMFVQVNRAPSFATDSKLDLHVKAGVIRDALRIINIQSVNLSLTLVGNLGRSRTI